jgi:twitching motility protein PilT
LTPRRPWTASSASFRYIISQRLIPRADGRGRVAAIEILKSTSRTKEYIEKGESEGKSLLDAMEQGEQEGMQTFDGVLDRLIRKGVVTKDDALPYATNLNNLMLRLSDWDEGQPEPEAAPAAGDQLPEGIER